MRGEPIRGFIWLAGLLCLLAATAVSARTEVAQVLFARGAATASFEGETRLIGNGSPLFEGDVITTGSRSFAIVEYVDDTRMTVRPGTVIRIERFEHEAEEENALLRLFKGGLRAITGFVSKRNPGGFRIETRVATIGIRGTDFTARLCEEDCAEEQERLKKKKKKVKAAAKPRVIGRIAFLKGTLEATSRFGEAREMVTGAPFYGGDTLETGVDSFAVLAFRDESRITLQAETRFQIERHRYDEAEPGLSGALMRLFRGGLRVVTGLIGKAAPESYEIETPVASISVRGTRFDLICTDGGCTTEGAAQGAVEGRRPLAMNLPSKILDYLIPVARAQPRLDPGVLLVNYSGTTAMESLLTGETFLVTGEQIGFLTAREFRILPEIPAGLAPLGPNPVPHLIPRDEFEAGELEEIESGTVVVSVRGGAGATVVDTEGETTQVGAGETAAVVQGRARRVQEPDFNRADPYLRIDPSRAEPGALPPSEDPGALICRGG